MKKLVSLMLSLIMICSLSISVFAAPMIRSFKDVPNSHWAYEPIMEMVEQGIFAGTTASDSNGVGTFSPDSTMTRAQFITLISRICDLSFGEFGAKAEEMASYKLWYEADWHRCVDAGIINSEEFGGLDGMSQAITREEMALLINRVLDYNDEDTDYYMDLLEIPDWEKIDSSYVEGVLVCYEKGILVGVDSVGSFNPKGILTRAQGATVLYRVLNEEARNIPGMKVRDIPSLNLDLRVPENISESCGTTEYLSLIDKGDENNDILVTPIRIYETKDFTYSGKHYIASEGNHYFIMDILVLNDNIPSVTMSDYFFKVSPNPFVSNHDTFISYSEQAVFGQDTLKENTTTAGFVVFEIPSTCDFIGENSLTFHISGIGSDWTSGGGVDLFMD